MTEKKWTPGPWVWDFYDGCDDGENVSGKLCGETPVIWHAESVSKHDANLIKASLDLYEALENMLRYEPQGVIECRGDKCREPWCASCNGWDDAEKNVETVEAHFKQARTALAKARGEK